MTVMKFGVGQPVRRVEDQRLVRGAGRYTSDLAPEGSLYAHFIRSPHAHARFTVGDRDQAAATPGVKAVLVASDVSHLGDLPCLGRVKNSDGTQTPLKPYPVMAKDEAHHVGDIVAMIVAESIIAAKDGAEALAIDWEALPAVADSREALRPGAVQVFAGAPGNLAFDAHFGDKSRTDAIFTEAAHVVRIEIVNPRVVANFLEPRGAVGTYEAGSGRLTLHVGSQGVHGLRDLLVRDVLKIPPETLRVVTGDVGGGFGTRIFLYREYALVLEAARRLHRPVRWQAERTEHFVGDAQGRDNVTTAEMALDAEGRFLALRVDILANLGAYPSQFGPYVPWLGATMASGPYQIDTLHARVRGVYTHTLPVDAYRGAGRPEAAYVLERLVDRCARELKLSRETIRLRNFVPPDAMPYQTQTNRTYDVGDFAGALKRCVEKADAAGFEARAAESKARGFLRGLGYSSYIECTAWDGEKETSLLLEKDGTLTLLIGTQSTGQGHETAYAQVVAQQFDVPLDRIKVVQGDSDRISSGEGTGGSRSIPIGAVTTARASKALAESLKELAADKLEAATADLEIVDGRFRIVGTDRSLVLAEIAALPSATPDRLRRAGSYTPDVATYPNGTHICEVEIDPETGTVQILRHTVVDDFGFTLNPLLLEGQVHGGIAQGAGQALMEKAVYDSEGQLLSASLMDYCLPRADNFPPIEFETRNVPSTTNPMGLKGAGEAGTIGSTPAVVNAVADALWRAYGVADIDMPATSQAIFRAIRQVETAKRASG
jgi:aerobic carbon-monoxide dehydrogenase large subunit